MVELFGAVLLLFGLSDLLFRFLGLGAYAHGSRREPKVALTCDDGPSERTEALLALLAAWGVARLAWARLGGLNGDALGAMIALGEVVLLLAQALLGPAPSSRAGPGLP